MIRKNKKIKVEILVDTNKILNWLNILTKHRELKNIDFKFVKKKQYNFKSIGSLFYYKKIKNLYQDYSFDSKLLKNKEKKLIKRDHSTDIIMTNSGFDFSEKNRAKEFLLWFPQNTVSFDQSNIYKDSISTSYISGRKLSSMELFLTSPKYNKISCFRNLTVINEQALCYSHETYYSKIIVLLLNLFKKLLKFGFDNFQSNLIDNEKFLLRNNNQDNNLDKINLFKSIKRIMNLNNNDNVKRKWKIKIKKINNSKNLLYKKSNPKFKDDLKEVSENQSFSMADPFLFKNNNETWLFFEKISTVGKGSIFAINLDSNKTKSQFVPIFNKPFHMSFPNIFSHEGEIFMIPETAQLRKVNLYKCKKFPDKWIKVKTLLENVYATDTIIFYWDKIFWMFTEIRPENSYDSDLIYLFWSKSLTGKWIEHPMNPIINNPNNSRAAGQIFLDDNKIIRPAQSSLDGYGSSIKFMRILELSKKHFLEEIFSNLNPQDLSVKKVHSYTKSRDYEAIDVFI